ncbi:MAG: hypothetical protein HY535_02125 [Chloroflexi bacterium]|nr:hypothetical protein [Chloroflexota bacterium]
MRRLLYVPIIHSDVDLGSAGLAIAQSSLALSGERRWALHHETVRSFWKGVAAYLCTFDARLLRVYQDGLAADGEQGRGVVDQAARRGSENFRLVRDLVQQGAELRKTEDPALLLREYHEVLGLVRPPSQEEGRDRTGARAQLLEERDRFIAEAISGTLHEGEVGVLFLGARHDVTPWLAPDISVMPLKDRSKVQAYIQELLLGQDERVLAKLARYLAAPVRVP